MPPRKSFRRTTLAAGLAAVLLAALAVWVTLTGRSSLPRLSATPPPDATGLSEPTRLATIADVPPTKTATPTATITPPPTVTLTPTLAPLDYRPMREALTNYLAETSFDLSIGFVDVQTGQVVSLGGEERHYALSTFKGPLAAYYLWQVERGLIALSPDDVAYIKPMLEVSSNPATTCVFKRVGGIEPFNDWLVNQGMSRENNFVLAWGSWPCEEGGQSYVPAADTRYSLGDAALGLPGGWVLLRCAPDNTRCDKAFAPLELAVFYARLARGEVLDGQHTALWLRWMEKDREASAFLEDLPDDERIHAYTKNGFRAADALYENHFYHEAGLIDTGQGVFALAVFMQGNPDWPGTGTLSEVARIAYDHFVAARLDR